jgi:anti-anti-sigma factor
MPSFDDSGPARFTLAEEADADGSLALRLMGDIDVTNASEVETLLRQATAEGPRTLVVDLRLVTFLDTAGVRLLILAHRWQQGAGNYLKVVLTEGEGTVRRVLELSGLTALFELA